MTQSRRASLIEAILNVGSGFIVALFLTAYVLPLWGYEYSFRQVWEITAVYTAVSILRSYLWRRLFNWWGAR